MEKISCTDRVRNFEILQSQEGEEYHTYSKKEGRLVGWVAYCAGTASSNTRREHEKEEASSY
jgi:hypothetical protein